MSKRSKKLFGVTPHNLKDRKFARVLEEYMGLPGVKEELDKAYNMFLDNMVLGSGRMWVANKCSDCGLVRECHDCDCCRAQLCDKCRPYHVCGDAE